ncbi:MAG: MFS transporter [Phycisphaerae bacterium]|nr:MFS transporter [Phycisphaerae bacterium]
MIDRLTHRFRPALPALSQRNFRHEIVSVALMAAGLACIDVNVLGVLADKAFHAGPWVITIIAASDSVAHVTSFLWARWLHGSDRVRSANALQFCVIACVLAVAAAPLSGVGIAMLVGLTILGRVFITGIVNARTDIWRANYPRDARGLATGRLTVAATFVIALTGLSVALSMDVRAETLDAVGLGWLHGHAFRVIYVLAAMVALMGARVFSRVRWRGRAAQMKAERERAADGAGGASPRAMWKILKRDREYRRFMAAQFMLGWPNLAAVPIFILALKDHFSLQWTQSMLLTRVIPILIPVLVVPMWGRLLDRMHIVRFRSYHSWVFVVANGLMAAAFLSENLVLLYVARVVLGVAFGGGLLAWELGHHDFARREEAASYMAIHVTLTGVRGMFAPFLGTWLYASLDPGWFGLAADGKGLGAWTFLVLALLSVWGAMMFVTLYRDTRHRTRGRPGRD